MFLNRKGLPLTSRGASLIMKDVLQKIESRLSTLANGDQPNAGYEKDHHEKDNHGKDSHLTEWRQPNLEHLGVSEDQRDENLPPFVRDKTDRKTDARVDLSSVIGISKLSPHAFRHMLASHLLARGMGIRYIQKYWGIVL